MNYRNLCNGPTRFGLQSTTIKVFTGYVTAIKTVNHNVHLILGIPLFKMCLLKQYYTKTVTFCSHLLPYNNRTILLDCTQLLFYLNEK
jgi:hypothetical protein